MRKNYRSSLNSSVKFLNSEFLDLKRQAFIFLNGL